MYNFNNIIIIVVGMILVSLSFVDTTIGISFLYDYDSRSSKQTYNFLSFNSIVTVIGQILLLYSIISNNKKINSKLNSRFLRYSPYCMFGVVATSSILFSSMLIDIYVKNRYEVFFFQVMVNYNFLISFLLIGILVFKLVLWLNKSKNLFIFLYMVAFSLFFIATVSSYIVTYKEIEKRADVITPIPNPWDRTSLHKSIFFYIYRITYLLSFGFIWLATIFLLKNYNANYTNKIHRKKYWTLVSLPLIYYLASTDLVLNALTPIIFQFPLLTTIIIYGFGATKQVGGIFFALVFLFLSKNLFNKNLKYYLILSAVGLMTSFSSIQNTILLLLPYPPFGLLTLSLLPISSYLLLIGLYYSAKTISRDKKLLDSLKNQIKNEPSLFLKSIGSAEWNNDMEKRINRLLKLEEYKVEYHEPSLSNEDIKEYISEVIKDIESNNTNNSKK